MHERLMVRIPGGEVPSRRRTATTLDSTLCRADQVDRPRRDAGRPRPRHMCGPMGRAGPAIDIGAKAGYKGRPIKHMTSDRLSSIMDERGLYVQV